MYVRPYIEDPVWLQPDDEEMQQLYGSETKKGDKRITPHAHHDLPGDPDLENPDDEELEDYEDSDDKDYDY